MATEEMSMVEEAEYNPEQDGILEEWRDTDFNLQENKPYWLQKGADGTVRRKPATRLWFRPGNEGLVTLFCLNYALHGSIAKACEHTIIPDTGKKLYQARIHEVKHPDSQYYIKEIADVIQNAKEQFDMTLADIARQAIKRTLVHTYTEDKDLISVGRLAIDSIKAIEKGEFKKPEPIEANVMEARVIQGNVDEWSAMNRVLENVVDFDGLTADDADALLPTES